MVQTAQVSPVRLSRQVTPDRWVRAAERARTEGVQVHQLQDSGAWIATSDSQRGVAYELAVTGNVAHGSDCLAGLNAQARRLRMRDAA